MIKNIKYYQELSKYIYWKEGKPYWLISRGNKAQANTLAGYHDKDGYRVISIRPNNGKGKKKLLKAHRLSYYMKHGKLPEYIDHKDRNKDNNDWPNLRPSTISQNAFNYKSNRGTSIYRGVHWHKDREHWIASIRLNDKHKFLGSFDNEMEAAMAYDQALFDNNLKEFGYFNFYRRLPKEILAILDWATEYNNQLT